MNNFTTKQIAELFNVSEETVRRWIRTGKLKSNMSSKKSGNVISSDSLKSFINKTPKYFSTKSELSPMVFSLIIGDILSELSTSIDIEKRSISLCDVEKYLKDQINSLKKELNLKMIEMENFKREIKSEQQKLDEYKYIYEKIKNYI